MTLYAFFPFSLDVESLLAFLRLAVFALVLTSMFGGCSGAKHRPADLPGFTFTFAPTHSTP